MASDWNTFWQRQTANPSAIQTRRAYATAGVELNAGNAAVERIKAGDNPVLLGRIVRAAAGARRISCGRLNL
jgi:hypothetical protein